MKCKCGHVFEEGDEVVLIETADATWKEPELDITYPQDKEYLCPDCAFMRR